jgi:hypothetical protein
METNKQSDGSDTITPSLVAQAVMQGEKFEPQNEAQERLKREIASLPPGSVMEIPNDFDFR